MQCHSCGILVAPGGGYTLCADCGRADEVEQQGGESRVLVTDGGHDEDDETYLDPDEIVGDDIADENPDAAGEESSQQPDDSAESEPPESADSTDQPDESEQDEPRPDAASDTTRDDHQPGTQQGGEGSDSQQGGEGSDPQQGSTGSDSQQGSEEDETHQPQCDEYPEQGAQAGAQQDRTARGQATQQDATQRQGHGTGGRQGSQRQDPQGVESGSGFVGVLQQFPLRLGAALGAIAFLVPYLLITIAAYWVYEESPIPDPEMGAFDVGAEVFLTIVGLGSGERVVDFFIGMADVSVTSPGDVDPADYPTVEAQLEAVLPLLDSNPEVPLLLLYLVAPYVLFVSGRYLARHYAPSATALDRVLAGATVALGTVPVVLGIGVVFETFALVERVLFTGLFLPAAIGALGGLSIRFFDDHSAIVSTLFGWAAIALGVVVAAALLPLPDLGGAELTPSFLDRLVVSLGTYLNAVEFNMGAHAMGRLYFLLVVAVTTAVGFVRTWRADPVGTRMDGARVGASIWLGFVAPVALFLWAFPMSTALVDVFVTNNGLSLVSGLEGEAIGGVGRVLVPTIEAVVDVDSALHSIAVSGFVFPAIFGGIGGYLAVWYDERPN
jgi:hypothetical protein